MNTNNDLRKKAFYLTVGTNILFFLLLMIIVAWKETYPPPEEYGIELGFENNELSDADSESFEENDEEVENQIVEDLEIEESMEPETIIEDAVAVSYTHLRAHET